jgi:hypothetical protein
LIMRIVLILILFLAGCPVKSKIYQYNGIPSHNWIESSDLPIRPDADKIPEDKDWAISLHTGACAESDGILLSPEKAVRAKSWQNGYNSLRDLYEIDRKVWAQHRIIYEDRIARANKDLRSISPTWWDENKATIAWSSGFIMGAVASIAIVFALGHVLQ